MKNCRIYINFGFLLLLSSRFVWHSLHFQLAIFFCVGASFYSLLVGLYLANVFASTPKVLQLKTTTVVLCTGYAVFGLGGLLWGCLNNLYPINNPLGVHSDLIYSLSSIMFLYGILVVGKQNKFDYLKYTTFILLSVMLFIYFLRSFLSRVGDIVSQYYVFFFFISFVFVFLHSHREARRGQKHLVFLLLLMNILWVSTDIDLGRRFFSGVFYIFGLSDILDFTSEFMVFINLTFVLDRQNLSKIYENKTYDIIKVLFCQKPTSLNCGTVR